VRGYGQQSGLNEPLVLQVIEQVEFAADNRLPLLNRAEKVI